MICSILFMNLTELGNECRLSESYPNVNIFGFISHNISNFAEILGKRPPCKQWRVKRKIKVFGS